jgi:hypothetical protein
VEIGLVIKLVVQLQVPTIDLNTVKLEESGSGLFSREGTSHRGHMEKHIVQREPQKFRRCSVVSEVIGHRQAQLCDEHFNSNHLLQSSRRERKKNISLPPHHFLSFFFFFNDSALLNTS